MNVQAGRELQKMPINIQQMILSLNFFFCDKKMK
jgi:hypothetical protein